MKNTEEYGVYSPFDLEKHKEIFQNYLEVIIEPNGAVHYAVPSHQEFLIKYICDKGQITRDQLNNLCPESYYGDFVRWLCMVSGCISVYEKFYVAGDDLTYQQHKIMKELYNAGVYKGKALWLKFD